MRKLYYMGLEPYEGRYTLQLQQWCEKVFRRRGINYVVVPGATIDDSKSISVGQVLDAHGRSYFGMSQLMNLVQLMKDGEVTSDDVVLFEDMFQPGIESLPYIMDQVPEKERPQVWVRCLAQTIDPDDFVHVWNMPRWMTHYERMVDGFVTGILASNEEMVANIRVAGWQAPVYNISGLAFDSNEVRSRVKEQGGWQARDRRVVFASRWDQEKQPDFYMDLIEHINDSSITFSVLPSTKLRSNRPDLIQRARSLEARGQLEICPTHSKDHYYSEIARSRVLFNCALQDWTSVTVSEADALGTNVLFPAYRSFPETFNNDHERLYIPWSLDDAAAKLLPLLENQHPRSGDISNWTDGTVDRILDIITSQGDKWRRDPNTYRLHTRINKR
jgi:hypothetical protein